MDVSLVVPAYNEAGNLPALLDDLERLVSEAPCAVEVIVVDDGSTDGTGPLIRDHAARRPWLRAADNGGNLGMGATLLHGTSMATHPLVGWVMADRSDRLSDLWEMRRRLLAGADLVVASRAAAGGSYGTLVGVKSLGSRGFSAFARRLLGLPVHDATNAFRMFRRELTDNLALRRRDFAISPEMVFRAVAAGRRVEEVPTVYAFRQHGMSDFALLRMGWAYLTLALRARLGRRPPAPTR